MNHGFKLIEQRYIRELESDARLLLHEKSGARLFHIKNQDDNKVFSISFRTPPVDNTGLTHILEHSVLCGSRKFPTKEPFVDLAKGSLNTFLNAMTFADKTMYPVASKNEKDFYNLVDVYMDAVLYPRIYECPEIMMQEGWHYEIDNKANNITYKGVVYNEMLGAFSSAEEILFSRIMETLYPDTAYGFESGGDPAHIMELTYETFLDYHRKYYHPANSYIYFYGNGDLDKMLEFLDSNYLSAFDAIDVWQDHEISDGVSGDVPGLDGCGFSTLMHQRAFEKPVEKIFKYPVSSKEEEQDGTYISMNFVVGNACDARLSMSMDILEYMLLETPASPLKRALIDAEIGRDVIGNYDEGILQPMFNIVLKDSDATEKDDFIQIVTDTLEELAENGIDQKLVEASINSLEFKFREANGEDTPKGLLFGIRCMDSWLYDSDPFKHLLYEGHLTAIKQLAQQGYFEQLIRTYLLENKHASIVMLIPEYGLAEKRERKLAKRLDEYKKSLAAGEMELLLQNNKKLLERQNAEDSEEDRSKIPMVSLQDIRREAEMPPIEIREEAGTTVLYHRHHTNGIVYLDLLFDTSAVSEEKLHYIAFLSDVIGLLSTTTHSYGELSNEVDINTGGISFNVDAYEEVGSGRLHPKFIVETKALTDKLDREVELINDILHNTIFNDEKRLWEIILETKADIEIELVEEGHSVASKRLCSYFSRYANYLEKLTGLSYYNFIADLEVDFEEHFSEIAANLQEISQLIFTKNGLVASVTCDDKEYAQFSGVYPQIVDKLCGNVDSIVDEHYVLAPDCSDEGIFNSSNIVHVTKGFNYMDHGFSYNGQLQVLKNILSVDYLWNRVRVVGGAYGAFARFEMSGNAYFVSYRDPNLAGTLEIFDTVSDYLCNFYASEREMEKYIIGTISSLDQPLTPQQSAQRADEMYFRKISAQDIQKERDEILAANADSMRQFASLAAKMVQCGNICAVGGENIIKQSRRLFSSVYNMFDNAN